MDAPERLRSIAEVAEFAASTRGEEPSVLRDGAMGWVVEVGQRYRVVVADGWSVESPQAEPWSRRLAAGSANAQKIPHAPRSKRCPVSDDMDVAAGGRRTVVLTRHSDEGRIDVQFDGSLFDSIQIVVRSLDSRGPGSIWGIIDGGAWSSLEPEEHREWSSPGIPPGTYRVDVAGYKRAEDRDALEVMGFQGELRRGEVRALTAQEMRLGTMWVTIDSRGLSGSADLFLDMPLQPGKPAHRIAINNRVRLGTELTIGPFSDLNGIMSMTSPEKGDLLSVMGAFQQSHFVLK